MGKESNLLIPNAKDIAKDEYSVLSTNLSGNFTRTITAGPNNNANYINGLLGVRCHEGTISHSSSIVNYPSTVSNITLVLNIIDSVNYFTESEKRDLHIFINEWNSGSRNYPDFNIALKRYQEILNIPSKEEARKKIKKTLDVLSRCSLFIRNDKSKLNYSNINIPIFYSTSYKKNVISLMFSNNFFTLLKETRSFVIINQILFQIPINKSTAVHLYWRLANHNRMNINKHNESIIPVSSLIESCSTFPSEAKIENDFTNRIRKPFEKYMEYLCEIGILNEWTYCYSNGLPLNDKDLNNKNRLFYNKFKSYHVKFILKNGNEIKEAYLYSEQNRKKYKNQKRSRASLL